MAPTVLMAYAVPMVPPRRGRDRAYILVTRGNEAPRNTVGPSRTAKRVID